MGIRNTPNIKIKHRGGNTGVEKMERESNATRYSREELFRTFKPLLDITEEDFQRGAGKPSSLRDKQYQLMRIDVPAAALNNFMNFCRSYNEKWKQVQTQDVDSFFWLKDRNANQFMNDYARANYGNNKSYRYFRVLYQDAANGYGPLSQIEMTRFVEGPAKKGNLKMAVTFVEPKRMTPNSRPNKDIAHLMFTVDLQNGHFRYRSEDFKIFQEFIQRVLTLPEEEIFKPEKD